MFVLAVQFDEADERSFNAPAVASVPLMNARLRPWDVISRRTSNSPRRLEDRLMAAASLPVRTRSPEARPPSNSPRPLDEDRLPRAGFAGQDVQARVELDFD